jgi:hypothetical protein
LGPQQSGPDLTEILIRLRRIRTEITALTPLADRPVASEIVHDLDEVIQRAGLAASGLVSPQELPPLPESRRAPTHEAVHLPSGPDYWPPTYR